MTDPLTPGAPAAHDPYVVPYQDVVDAWVVRCGCGLYETQPDQQSADTRAAEHRETGS